MNRYQRLLFILLLVPIGLSAQRYYEEIQIIPREEITDTTVTENIYYETAQYGLLVPQIRVLDKINRMAKEATRYQINLYGYTDHHGSFEYNDSLAQRRVGTAQDYMLLRRLDPDLITAHPLGEIPLEVGQNASPDSLQSNRRVTIQAHLTYIIQYFDTITYQVNVPCPEQDTIFITDNGTIIEVPGCAYQNSGILRKDLEYELADAYTRRDMISGSLTTLTTQNECLKTSGMVKFYARDQYDDFVYTDEGKYITVYVPTDLFEEEVNLFLASGRGQSFGWEPLGEKPEQLVDPNNNRKYYVYKTRGNFFINLDIGTGIFEEEITTTLPNPHYKVRRFKEPQLDTYLTGERSNLDGEFFKKRKFYFSACECIPESERTVTLIATKRNKHFVYHKPLEEVRLKKQLFGKGTRYLIRKRDFDKIKSKDEISGVIAGN